MSEKRGVPASQLARDYGVSLNDFIGDVMSTLAKLDGAASTERSAPHRREICAAVHAAMTAALDASTLTVEEREKFQPPLTQVLAPFWARHCASDPDAAAYIAQRANHYLSKRAQGSQVKTAVGIVTELLEALEVPPAFRAAYSRTLAPAFAHRMVGDVYHLNEVHSRFGLELSLVAAASALLQLSMTYDPILRIFWIH